MNKQTIVARLLEAGYINTTEAAALLAEFIPYPVSCGNMVNGYPVNTVTIMPGTGTGSYNPATPYIPVTNPGQFGG